MTPNAKISDILAVLDTVDPVSQAAGTVSTGWINVADFDRVLAILDVGAFGAASTANLTLQQATSSGGAGAKAIGSGKTLTAPLATAGGNNVAAMINVASQELDTNNGFNFVQAQVAITGVATLVSCVLLGSVARFNPPVDPTANPAINLGSTKVQQIIQ